MGGFAALHFGIAYAKRALLAGRRRLRLRRRARQARAVPRRDQGRRRRRSRSKACPRSAKRYALGPTRVQFQNKDPRGWREFADQLAEHSTLGSALTMRGVQARRPSLWELVDDMKTIEMPTLIVTGDEDDPCLEPALLMKRAIPTAGARRAAERRATPSTSRTRRSSTAWCSISSPRSTAARGASATRARPAAASSAWRGSDAERLRPLRRRRRARPAPGGKGQHRRGGHALRRRHGAAAAAASRSATRPAWRGSRPRATRWSARR